MASGRPSSASGALGPKLNADGYHVGRIRGHLYWVTDANYQAMFLTGVVLVDAPPTLGRNLLRAIDQVTKVSGLPNKVTHLVYSHSHAVITSAPRPSWASTWCASRTR